MSDGETPTDTRLELKPTPEERKRVTLSGKMVADARKMMRSIIQSATTETIAEMLDAFQEHGWLD